MIEQQPKQEPVAYSYMSRITGRKTFSLHPKPPHLDSDSWDIKPLYTEPPQPEQNQFNPDWDTQAVLVEEQQRMAKRIEELEAAMLRPTREWVGLTEEDISAISKKLFGSTYDAGSDRHFARAIETKLKEKNT